MVIKQTFKYQNIQYTTCTYQTACYLQLLYTQLISYLFTQQNTADSTDEEQP